MTEEQFLLNDRIAKIRAWYESERLERFSYIAYSGGKDSSVVSKLFDIAVPENKIPRVFTNTGIEYKAVVSHVQKMASDDSRIVIIKPENDVKKVLEENGYPFKSKEHSQKVATFQNSGLVKSVQNYLKPRSQNPKNCPKALRCQFEEGYSFKISAKCCTFLKKKPAQKYMRETGRNVTITGMRRAEGGARLTLQCQTFDSKNNLRLNVIAPMSDSWVDWFVKEFEVELPVIYFPPFSMRRTGCRGCPFDFYLAEDLEMLKERLPTEYAAACSVFGKVYEEYRRLNFRLK